jgi:hypothetical protein
VQLECLLTVWWRAGELVVDTQSRKRVPHRALFAYNPTTDSPNDDPEAELAFQAGEIIIVIGDSEDG